MRIPIVPEGWHLILPVSGVALVFLIWACRSHRTAAWVTGILLIVVALLLVNFFRDPERHPLSPLNTKQILCPADGVVVELKVVKESMHLKKEAYQVAIFMNVFNNHVQRMPFPGKVVDKTYYPGKFMAAFAEKASLDNEQSHLVVELKGRKGSRMVLKQIAGLLARRVVTDAKVGDVIAQGDRFGRILLGSRVDVFLPKEFIPAVKLGDKVKAGVTVLGELK